MTLYRWVLSLVLVAVSTLPLLGDDTLSPCLAGVVLESEMFMLGQGIFFFSARVCQQDGFSSMTCFFLGFYVVFIYFLVAWLFGVWPFGFGLQGSNFSGRGYVLLVRSGTVSYSYNSVDCFPG